MVNALQKATCKAIVNLFETGTVRGRYDSVVFVEGDAGHLTYGSSQTTLASGNLFLLIDRYCKAKNNLFGDPLSAYLGRLEARDFSLDTDATLRGLLHSAGSDPVMQDTQDSFFDAVYWTPAEAAAAAMGLKLPLSVGVVYDSTIHGAWQMMRNRTVSTIGAPTADERPWIKKYIEVRRAWLAGSPAESLLPKTVYRMDTFRTLIAADAWDLALPLNVRGAEISTATLKPTANTPIVASAVLVETARLLSLRNPAMFGDDVGEVQEALKAAGQQIVVDKVFGPQTDKVVRAFQKKKKLIADGIVGAATRSALGLH
ncbi:MAG: chitosanase [Reyranella sp.]|uniref:peptidoglycan-binding protein n=1 Tax=Reyranella sp. TaxID=1929291 RepID=UPI001201AD7F|nr:peptidoglycan-binding protein [Reyranella sp.]TAJ85746.1 MAG: chitosanase [Reyranella sp.]